MAGLSCDVIGGTLSATIRPLIFDLPRRHSRTCGWPRQTLEMPEIYEYFRADWLPAPQWGNLHAPLTKTARSRISPANCPRWPGSTGPVHLRAMVT
jgi:hypothetical protein